MENRDLPTLKAEIEAVRDSDLVNASSELDTYVLKPKIRTIRSNQPYA